MESNTINVLALKNFTVLFFYSEGSSLQKIKQVEKLVKECMPSIDFLKIDIRNNPKVSTSFNVPAAPFVLILQNGKEIWRQRNGFSEDEILDYLTLMSTSQ